METKPKIYLAKSARSNPDHVSKVRAIISEYDVEIVEFTGGAYYHDDLLECDMLVVIPDLSSYDWLSQTQVLGKGLHSQIEVFKSEKNFGLGYENILILDSVGVRENTNIYVRQPISLLVEDSDDYVEHSRAELSSTRLVLTTLLESEFDYHLMKKGGIGTSNGINRRYLLIK